VDWERMIDSTIKGKVEEFLKLVGMSWEEIYSGHSLDEYF